MEEQLLSIREMSAAFGVTARTLRFYESKELLAPRREGQKRLFTRRDQARLKLILRGKRFGFSLESIREMLDLYDHDSRHVAQLERSCVLARERIAEMEQQHRELGEAIAELHQELARGETRLHELRQAQTECARAGQD